MKTCRNCLIEKPETEFSFDKRWRGQYKLDCKPCINKAKRLLYNPTARRIEGLKYLYNITESVMQQMYEDQKESCAICKTSISLLAGKTKKGKAHVDHCHTTGKVRGLLCTKCNTMLGMADDNIATLNKAISYLEEGSNERD